MERLINNQSDDGNDNGGVIEDDYGEESGPDSPETTYANEPPD